MIVRSTQLILEAERGDLFGVPMMWRSGVRFTALWDMIWNSAKLFWIGRRFHPQLHRCHRNLDELISIGQILMEMSRWGRSILSSGQHVHHLQDVGEEAPA
jgi:hypothetical protein